ncbi:MAG: hypothetical protein AB7I79_01385 [Rhizobiaceae bacterium]
MKALSLRTLAFSTFLSTIAANSAFGQDATAVAERLKAVLANQGITISWTAVTGGGDTVVIEGVSATMTGAPETAAVGNVTLSQITEADGGYTVGLVTFPDYSITEDGVTVDATGIQLTGLKLPAEGSADPLSTLMMYETADVGLVSVKMGDKQMFSMESTHFEISPPADGSAMEFSGAAEKFSADLSLVEDPVSKQFIAQHGYETINGYFELAGTWQPTDGRMALSQYDIAVEDAGAIGFTFDLGGYTPDFIKQMQDLQKQMAEGGENSAAGMAMLGMMQQLTFHSTSIRFDDDSITGKVLEFVAAQQGMKAADIANQAKAVVPFLLAQLNNPEFTTQVTAAVTKYLDDPQSLEVTAEPASPVPFAVVMAGAMSGAPQELIKTLGVTVTANED